jgi:diaminohydroxyphosphoribosylaminopyrimidine deaminase/5-amino-6-(5-phosphoribosylamino)uracil reductase
MKKTFQDQEYLKQTIELANIRRGFCTPNPSVGAVIVKDNKILATGYHLQAGAPHAEIDALSKLDYIAENATLYVSLEPCCHTGRTPPCTDAIIKSKIKKVVYGYQDPNPIVSGKGDTLLRSAGISCEYLPLPEISNFYKSYRHWHLNKTPFVTANIAITIDGKYTGKKSPRLMITGKEINQFTHECRKKSDAILTTAKTILHDDPQLNVRIENETIAKKIYILDTQLSMPLNAKIFSTAKAITIFYSKNAKQKNIDQLKQKGAALIEIAETNQRLNLTEVIKSIGQDGIHDLWVEAGGTCFSEFIKNKLAQRALIYVAPKTLTEGISAFTDNFDFTKHTIQWKQYGQDVLCDIEMGN